MNTFCCAIPAKCSSTIRRRTSIHPILVLFCYLDLICFLFLLVIFYEPIAPERDSQLATFIFKLFRAP
jgi:hypothetical protein